MSDFAEAGLSIAVASSRDSDGSASKAAESHVRHQSILIAVLVSVLALTAILWPTLGSVGTFVGPVLGVFIGFIAGYAIAMIRIRRLRTRLRVAEDHPSASPPANASSTRPQAFSK